MNRRDFIIKSSQISIAAAIGLMSGYLVFRDKPEEECDFNFVCRNCKKAKTCNLPEAKSNK